MAIVGVAFVFPRLEIERTVLAPPAGMATKRPSGAGATWLTAPGPGGVVDGSTRCVLGAAEPRRLETSGRGGGDAHAGRARIRAVLVAPMHDDADGRRWRRRIKRGPIGVRVSAGARRASSSSPVFVVARGDGDGGRSSRRLIRSATTAARAPRGALPPWRRGKSGAATRSA